MGNLNVIPDSRVHNIISKGLKSEFPPRIDFPICHREIASSLNDLTYRWCKRENVEPDVLKKWKINILKLLILVFHSTIVILFSSNLKCGGVKDFHTKYVFVQADKVANICYNINVP